MDCIYLGFFVEGNVFSFPFLPPRRILSSGVHVVRKNGGTLSLSTPNIPFEKLTRLWYCVVAYGSSRWYGHA